MMNENEIPENLIAICGMNCRLCSAYKRKKNGCLGCRAESGLRLAACDRCKIKNCELAIYENLIFCFQCESYPCKKILHIDKRYRTSYRMSMVENFELIKRLGLQEFLIREAEKWTCPNCGQLLSVHKPYCLHCQTVWREK